MNEYTYTVQEPKIFDLNAISYLYLTNIKIVTVENS